MPSRLLPPPRGRPPPLGDYCWPRGQGALRRRSPWGWRRKRPPTRSRPPGSIPGADGVPSRPRSRLSQATYRDGGRRLVPAEPLRPREGTHLAKTRCRGESRSARATASRGDSAESPRRRGTNSRTGPSKSSSSQSSRTSTGSLDGSNRASACSRVVLPAPVIPVTRTLRRWLRHGPQASSTPGEPCAHTKQVSRYLGRHRTHARHAASDRQAPSVS